MTTITFNPYPPKPPYAFPPGRYRDSDTLPNASESLARRFGRHYNRSGARRTDSVRLTGADLDLLRNDAELGPQLRLIEGRMVRRAQSVLARLPCEESAQFTDAGYELMPTTPYSPQSWAIGRYSLYWKATGTVGPRRCGIADNSCEGEERSEAAYSITMEWTAYDVFDFDWRLIFYPWFWFGTPFHVYGLWQTQLQGTLKTCNPAPPAPPPCQEPLTITVTYEVLWSAYREGGEKPPFNREGAIDSAMGRLLQDAKEWCSTGRCSDARETCIPRFRQVSARVENLRESADADGLIRCYAAIAVRASFICRCGAFHEAEFPHPTQ